MQTTKTKKNTRSEKYRRVPPQNGKKIGLVSQAFFETETNNLVIQR
jgi:hypothetical protein